MRICEPEFALDNVWHVLDVVEGSPAESAGLVPYGDYITGWSGGVLSAENDFYDLVEAVRPSTFLAMFTANACNSMLINHSEFMCILMISSMSFLMHNFASHRITSALREVVLVPNRHWGGTGLLGCVFGCVPAL